VIVGLLVVDPLLLLLLLPEPLLELVLEPLLELVLEPLLEEPLGAGPELPPPPQAPSALHNASVKPNLASVLMILLP
jgi:hypothetical protein